MKKDKKLPLTLRIEIAFAVTAYSKLPEDRKSQILSKLRSKNIDLRTEGCIEVGDLLCRVDPKEVLRFMVEKYPDMASFSGYMVYVGEEGHRQKCIMVGLHFHRNLPATGSEIPLPDLSE